MHQARQRYWRQVVTGYAQTKGLAMIQAHCGRNDRNSCHDNLARFYWRFFHMLQHRVQRQTHCVIYITVREPQLSLEPGGKKHIQHRHASSAMYEARKAINPSAR
jgi:hypothetical protein